MKETIDEIAVLYCRMKLEVFSLGAEVHLLDEYSYTFDEDVSRVGGIIPEPMEVSGQR